MGSPAGIFVGLPLDQLQQMQSDQIARIANGDRVSMSGGGKSSSKNFAMPPQDALVEINFAISRLTGTAVRSTHFDASSQQSALCNDGNI